MLKADYSNPQSDVVEVSTVARILWSFQPQTAARMLELRFQAGGCLANRPNQAGPIFQFRPTREFDQQNMGGLETQNPTFQKKHTMLANKSAHSPVFSMLITATALSQVWCIDL